MYTATGQIDREQLVEQYAPLVKRIAYLLISRLPANVQLEDLIQNGMIGLLDAFERYREGFGAQFETYASQRIRGAMLDGLREDDALPRQTRREMRRMEEMLRQLEHQNGRPPSEVELADALAMSLGDYQRLLQEARGHQLLYMDDFDDKEGENHFLDRYIGDNEQDPAVLFDNQLLRQDLANAVAKLPEREQLLMALYYDEELNQREVGEVIGVTDSRVCQLHNLAISRLRGYLFGAEEEPEKESEKEPEKEPDKRKRKAKEES